MEKTDPVVVTEDVLKFGSEEEVDLNANLKNSIQSYFQEHPADWADRATLLSWIWKVGHLVVGTQLKKRFSILFVISSGTK